MGGGALWVEWPWGALPEEVTLNPQEGEELITCRSGEENGWSIDLRREEEDMSLEGMRLSKILLAPYHGGGWTSFIARWIFIALDFIHIQRQGIV